MFVLLLLSGCFQKYTLIPDEKVDEDLLLTCQYVGGGIKRCENAEVICYSQSSDALQCHFKEPLEDEVKAWLKEE